MADDLPAMLLAVALAWFLLGDRRAARRQIGQRAQPARQRALACYAGLLTVLIAVSPPVNALAGKLFWILMIQRLLLFALAAPLIALGRPWISLWRALPPRVRRPVGTAVARSPLWAPIRMLYHALARPPGAWLAFSINIVLWHLPGPNDLTLRNGYAHVLADGAFLLFGILFWNQVTGSSRATHTPPYWRRIGYLASAMLSNVGLAIFLAFSQHPLYAPYAELAHRPGGITALADQQIGAGVMWAAGDVPFAIAFALLVQHWLAAQAAAMPRFDQLAASQLNRDGSATAGQPPALQAQAAALPLETSPAIGGHARREGPK